MGAVLRSRVVDQRAYRRACKRGDARIPEVPTVWLHLLDCGHWEERPKYHKIGAKLECHSCLIAKARGKFTL